MSSSSAGRVFWAGCGPPRSLLPGHGRVAGQVRSSRHEVLHPVPVLGAHHLIDVIASLSRTRPAQIWPYACVPDPDRSEPSREGRLDVRRSVAGPLSAASARYLPIGDSDFGAVNKTAIYRNGDIESLPNLLF